MTRTDVYQLIDDERVDQDRLWVRDNDNPKSGQYRYYAPHILLLEEKIQALRKSWYGSDKEALRSDMVKVAAIAVRAIEEVEPDVEHEPV